MKSVCGTCKGLKIVATQWPSGYPHATPCPNCCPGQPCSCGLPPGDCPSRDATEMWDRHHRNPTPRQLAWLLRYGEGLTLAEVGKRIDRCAEQARTLILKVEYRIPMSWRSNRPSSSMPPWWRRLRAANAFRPTAVWEHEPRRFEVLAMEEHRG